MTRTEAIEQCRREIEEAERMLRAGEPRENELWTWLNDQRHELRIILEEER